MRNAAQTARLCAELFTLASVLASERRKNESPERFVRRRQALHVALLEQNGLIDATGKPAGWTVEQDRQEELLALSELHIMRSVA